MQQRSRQAEALDGPGRECSHLAVQRLAEVKLFRDLVDTLGGVSKGKPVQLTEEEQVFPSRQARIETMVRARMVAQAPAHVARLPDRVVSSHECMSSRWYKQRGQNAE